MGKVSKATKHFSKKHLSDTLKTRKHAQKIKFRDKKKWGARKTPEELEAEKAAREGGDAAARPPRDDDDEDEEEEDEEGGKDAYKGNVDSFLEQGFFEALDQENQADGDEDGDDDDGEDSDGGGDGDDEESHKKELEALKEKDPEFFKYLQENDAGLLDFGEEDANGEDEGAEKADGGEERETTKAGGPTVLTIKMITVLTKLLERGDSFRGLRDLVRAFESACHIDDIDDKRGKGKKGDLGENDSIRLKFRILSGQVFERLMRVCITKMHHFFGKQLGLQGVDEENPAPRKINPQLSKKWKRISVLAKSYIKAMIGFSESLTDPVMVHLLLRHSERMLPYVRPFPKLSRKLLKSALRTFGQVEENRVQAFLLIRRMALEMPYPFIESCYKGMYLTYVRYTKFTNSNVQQGQTFMAQCVVEMFGLDHIVAYEHAFVYIRQLAMQLRGALTASEQKSKDSHQAITCWQFVNSLQLWGRMLCTYPAADQLAALVYPYAQVVMGVVRHINAPKYYPLRLKLCSMLTRVSYHAGVYIPLAPFYLDILSKKDLYKTSKRPGDQPIDFATQIKVSKQILQSRLYQEGALEETLKGILLFFASICYSPAFPEIIVQVVMQLKIFAKATEVNRFRRQVKDLIDKLEKNAAWVSRARGSSKITPQKAASLNCLKPAEGHAHQGLAPLHAVHIQTSVVIEGDLKALLESRNSKADGGSAKGHGDGDDEDDSDNDSESDGDDDESNDESEKKPRWKEARKQKRQQKRLEERKKRKAENAASKREDDDGEDVKASKPKKRKAKKSAVGSGGDAVHEDDVIEPFTMSSDED